MGHSESLPPGRELDRLIAEKVMGVAREYDDKGYDREGVHAFFNPLPHYSTDIAAAWEVVEKLREQFNVLLECVSFEFNCHINKPGSLGDRIHVRADTAPHAICLATLQVCKS